MNIIDVWIIRDPVSHNRGDVLGVYTDQAGAELNANGRTVVKTRGIVCENFTDIVLLASRPIQMNTSIPSSPPTSAVLSTIHLEQVKEMFEQNKMVDAVRLIKEETDLGLFHSKLLYQKINSITTEVKNPIKRL